jgi:hypothetical protein
VSQIENIITTTFRARGNQAIAQMGAVAQGFGNVGRVINENSRLSERLNNQWRALGTTIRYSLAGSAVFGLTRMVGQLRDVQQQMGLIAATGQARGSTPGGQAFTDPQVNRMANQLRQSAVDALTPVNEINDATINLLSTVQNVQPSEIPSIITSIGRAAKLSQTPVEDLTKAATTMNIAFGRQNNARNIGQFNRMWWSLIKEAPGGVSAAPQIAQQLPQLASIMALGQGPNTGAQTQSQMMSLVLGVLRTGSTPATGLRGLTYLLQSIIQPTGKARNALAGIGITPKSIEAEGVYPNLMRLLTRITHTGNQRQIRGLDDEALQNIDENGGTLPGIPAEEMTRLRTLIPRIHGIRAALILAQQLRTRGDILSLPQDLQLMEQAQNNQADDTHSLARAWERFQKRAQLQRAAIAMNALALQAAQTFQPILNLAARGLVGVQHQAQLHPNVTRGVILGGAAMIAALGTRRLLGFGGGNTLVRANAIRAAAAGGGILGATPQNPMYVVVVGQLFGGGARGVKGGGGGLDPTNPVNDYLGWRALRGLGRLAGRAGGRVAGSAAGRVAGRYGLRALEAGGPAIVAATAADYFINADDAGASNENMYQELGRARRTFGMPGIVGVKDEQIGQLHGRAEIFMTLDINQNGKITRKRVHVPMNMWGRGSVPSNRGKAGGSTRSSP